MASQNSDEMISIGGRWWSFPSAQIDLYSSEFEWRDGKLWLHESTGNVIEGTEVSDGTTEQFLREVRHVYPKLAAEWDEL